MAEFDFDDEPLDDAEGDEIENELTGRNALADNRFFARYRKLIVLGAIGIVVILGVVLFAIKLMGGNSKPATQNTKSAVVQEQEKPKKKKKVKYEILYTGVTEVQASEMRRELSLANIEYKTEGTGKNVIVSVDRDYLDHAKNILAMKGLPGNPVQGYELLDEGQTLGVTEFDKRVRFLRALSGELEKAIMRFDIIETCKVQIVLPEQRLFAVTQPPVTASILIRKVAGRTITDDVVFSIIQLVANAVENLQPENVSVINTQGIVLSNGIFERIAAREAGLDVLEPWLVQPDQVMAEEAPVEPSEEDIKNWLERKRDYERTLEDKAIRQLFGILPFASFKLAVDADLGVPGLSDGQEVKRLTTSVVVDNRNPDIYLDVLLKKQIFNTIAGAIGYVRGRDTIQLNKADYDFLSEQDLKRLQSIYGHKESSVKFNSKWLIIGGGVVASLVVLGLLIRFIRSRRQRKAENFELPFADQEEDSFNPDEFTRPAVSPISTPETPVQPNVDGTLTLVKQNPKAVAQILENWIETEEPEDDDDVIG